MIYRIRIILDCDEDVIRDIEIHENCSFEELHLSIIKYFNLEKGEMASFYISDDEWIQGGEIMLENFEANNQMLMRDTFLNTLFNDGKKKFIYIYDFLKLWTFFVDVLEISEKKNSVTYPKNIFSNGSLPQKAPKKEFISDDKTNDIFRDDELDYDSFY